MLPWDISMTYDLYPISRDHQWYTYTFDNNGESPKSDSLSLTVNMAMLICNKFYRYKTAIEKISNFHFNMHGKTQETCEHVTEDEQFKNYFLETISQPGCRYFNWYAWFEMKIDYKWNFMLCLRIQWMGSIVFKTTDD